MTNTREEMALPVRDQMKYWGIAAAVFVAAMWFLGDVLLPFIVGGAMAPVSVAGSTWPGAPTRSMPMSGLI